jgi:hypothetical protein
MKSYLGGEAEIFPACEESLSIHLRRLNKFVHRYRQSDVDLKKGRREISKKIFSSLALQEMDTRSV